MKGESHSLLATKALLNATHDLAYLLKKDWTIIDLNEAGAKRLNGRAEELIGKKASTFFPRDLLKKRQARLNEVFVTGKAVNFIDERNGIVNDNNIYPIFDEKGKVEAAAVFVKNITEREKVLEELKESERRFRDIALISADWIWEVDRDGKYIFASKKVKEILGYTPNELIGKTPFALMPKDEARRVSAIYKDISTHKKPINGLINLSLSKTGKKVWLETYGVPLLDNKGDFLGYRGVDKDITKSRLAEEKLRENEEKYRLITEGTSDLISVTTFSLNPTYLYIAPSIKDILFYTPDDLIGKRGLDYIHPDDRIKLLPILKKYLWLVSRKKLTEKDLKSFRQQIEYRYKDKKGSWHYLQSTVNIMEDRNLLFISKDITASKKAEENLKISEEKFKTFFEDSPDAYYILDEKGNFVDGNQSAEEMIGYKKSELIGKNFAKVNLLPLADLPKAMSLLYKMLKGEKAVNTITLIRKDKKQIRAELNTYPMVIHDKKYLIGIARDVTAKEVLEKELKESQEKYKTIFNSSPDVIVLLDQEGKVLDCNDLVGDWLKYKRSDIIGHPLLSLDFLTAESRSKVKEAIAKKFKGEKIEPYEVQFFNKKGKLRTALIKGAIIRDKAGVAIEDLVLVSDITDQKLFSQELKNEKDNFKRIVNSQLDALIIVDWKGKVLFANKATLKLGKFKSKEDIVGKNGFSFIHPDSRLDLFKDITNVQRGVEGYVNEYKLIDKTGNIVVVESIGGKIKYEGKERIVVSLRDVTARKKAESALSASQAKYKNLFESMQEGIVMVDMAGKILDCNSAYLKLIGYNREEALGLTYQQLTPKKWHEMESDIIRNEVLAKGASDEYQKEYIKKDGAIIAVVLKVWLTRDKNDSPIGMWAVVRDVTKELEMIRELRVEKELAQKYFDTSATLLVVISTDQKVQLINNIGCNILGYKTEEIVGKNWFDNFLPASIREEYRQNFLKLVSQPNLKLGSIFKEGNINPVLTNEGKERMIEWHNSEVMGAKGKILSIVSSGIDITGRLEAEVALKEKLSDLERINKLMVGREIKMIELKEKVRELKEKLKEKTE